MTRVRRLAAALERSTDAAVIAWAVILGLALFAAGCGDLP